MRTSPPAAPLDVTQQVQLGLWGILACAQGWTLATLNTEQSSAGNGRQLGRTASTGALQQTPVPHLLVNT